MSQKVDASINKKITDRFAIGTISEVSSFSFSGGCDQATSLDLSVYTTVNNTGNISYTLKLFLDDGLLDTISGTIAATAPVGSNPPAVTIQNLVENVENSIRNADKYVLNLDFLHTVDYIPEVRLGKF